MKREPYVSEANIRPLFLDMVEVKRYRFFTRFMKVCPNGEVYYECFMNDDVDAERKKRGAKK